MVTNQTMLTDVQNYYNIIQALTQRTGIQYKNIKIQEIPALIENLPNTIVPTDKAFYPSFKKASWQEILSALDDKNFNIQNWVNNSLKTGEEIFKNISFKRKWPNKAANGILKQTLSVKFLYYDPSQRTLTFQFSDYFSNGGTSTNQALVHSEDVKIFQNCTRPIFGSFDADYINLINNNTLPLDQQFDIEDGKKWNKTTFSTATAVCDKFSELFEEGGYYLIGDENQELNDIQSHLQGGKIYLPSSQWFSASTVPPFNSPFFIKKGWCNNGQYYDESTQKLIQPFQSVGAVSEFYPIFTLELKKTQQ